MLRRSYYGVYRYYTSIRVVVIGSDIDSHRVVAADIGGILIDHRVETIARIGRDMYRYSAGIAEAGIAERVPDHICLAYMGRVRAGIDHFVIDHGRSAIERLRYDGHGQRTAAYRYDIIGEYIEGIAASR